MGWPSPGHARPVPWGCDILSHVTLCRTFHGLFPVRSRSVPPAGPLGGDGVVGPLWVSHGPNHAKKDLTPTKTWGVGSPRQGAALGMRVWKLKTPEMGHFALRRGVFCAAPSHPLTPLTRNGCFPNEFKNIESI